MTSKLITADEANDLIEIWASQSLRVCFAVCFGDLAWYVHWVGPMHFGRSGRWIQIVDHMTNVLCPDLYQEIILIDDDELQGIRFRTPKGFTERSFEVNLFVDKVGNIDKEAPSLLQRIIH